MPRDGVIARERQAARRRMLGMRSESAFALANQRSASFSRLKQKLEGKCFLDAFENSYEIDFPNRIQASRDWLRGFTRNRDDRARSIAPSFARESDCRYLTYAGYDSPGTERDGRYFRQKGNPTSAEVVYARTSTRPRSSRADRDSVFGISSARSPRTHARTSGFQPWYI